MPVPRRKPDTHAIVSHVERQLQAAATGRARLAALGRVELARFEALAVGHLPPAAPPQPKGPPVHRLVGADGRSWTHADPVFLAAWVHRKNREGDRARSRKS